MARKSKIPKISKKYKKILKGKKRGKGEGLTLTTGLTKGQGLLKTDPNLSLQPLGKKLTKGKKVYKTIFSSKGTKESDMAQKNKKEKESKKIEFPKTTGAFTIQKGDSLSKISKMTGKSIKEIMAANKDITDPNKIRAGAGLKGLGKRSDYADFAKGKEFKPKKKDNKPAQKMPKTIDMGRKKRSVQEINRELRAKVNPKKPTTNIFKVKKGESTTRAADAKAKREAAQKKAGRGLTFPSAVKKKADTSLIGVLKRRFDPKIRKEKTEKRRDTRIKNRLLKANELPQGPKRDKAMEEAREYRRRQLNKKPFKITRTKITPLDKFRTDKFSKGGFVEVRMNKKSKGKGAGASLKGIGAVVK
tara:strand:- start:523 stop:1602 length:1080 start_codon:yes stop_codon:yes gene_type:complete